MTTEEGKALSPGDVVQIMPEYDPGDGSRAGWVGAFLLVHEVKSWGIQGSVHHVVSHEKSGTAFVRINFEHIEFIGEAHAVPADLKTSVDSKRRIGELSDGDYDEEAETQG